MPKQKVLFDASPMLDNTKTGVGYFVDRLFTNLSKQYSEELELTGYYFDFLNRHHKKSPQVASLNFYKIWLVPGKLLSLYRRLGTQPFLEMFVRSKAGTVIFTNYVSLPQLQRKRVVLVVYDLSFLDTPEFMQSINLKFLERFCPPSIQKADAIITISEFTKGRIKHYFPNLKANIVVTHIPPASDVAQKVALNSSLKQKGVIAKKYILYVGTIEPRKNIENLVLAYAALPPAIRAKYSLVLAGGKGWKDENILATIAEQQKKGAKIVLTGYVTDEEKEALYSNAACFVLPSHYEGFGMPLLEAMQHGIPTSASDIAVFREVAQDATLYFDKDSPADIANKISRILTSSTVAESLVSKGKKRLNDFSWKENAAKVYKILR